MEAKTVLLIAVPVLLVLAALLGLAEIMTTTLALGLLAVAAVVAAVVGGLGLSLPFVAAVNINLAVLRGQAGAGLPPLWHQLVPVPAGRPPAAVPAADRPAQTGRLGRLDQHPRHQEDGNDDLEDDKRVPDFIHGLAEVYP